MVLKQNDDAIHAFCKVCTADEYLIYEGEDTLWANGPVEPFDVVALAAAAGLSKPERPARDIDLLLERTLALLASHLTTTEARRSVARSASPTAMVQAILGTAAQPPAVATMERLLPVLMDLWNETPREELGGQSPDAVHAAGAATPRAPQVGRNDRCPCGSGRKDKKCLPQHPPPLSRPRSEAGASAVASPRAPCASRSRRKESHLPASSHCASRLIRTSSHRRDPHQSRRQALSGGAAPVEDDGRRSGKDVELQRSAGFAEPRIKGREREPAALGELEVTRIVAGEAEARREAESV